MSTLDEITTEKQWVSEALARVDAQREKLSGQLGELEATERVLARYSKGTPANRTASAKVPTTATKAVAQARPRARARTATATKPAGRKRTSSTLGDQVLALATGKTQQEIAAACKGARPNHVGVAIARHKRAGRIEERDGNCTLGSWQGQSNALRSNSGIKRASADPEKAPAGGFECPHLTVGVIAVQLIAQPYVDAAIP